MVRRYSLSLPSSRLLRSRLRFSQLLSLSFPFLPILSAFVCSELPSGGRTGPVGIFDEISGELRQWRIVLLFDTVEDWHVVNTHIDRVRTARRGLYFGVFSLMVRGALAGQSDELPPAPPVSTTSTADDDDVVDADQAGTGAAAEGVDTATVGDESEAETAQRLADDVVIL